jgi:hypothetical protein
MSGSRGTLHRSRLGVRAPVRRGLSPRTQYSPLEMSGELVRDRLVLGLLFVVGGSSLLWGLYLIFYISQTSPSGIFNTILGLLVLLITWAFLLPYALPAVRRYVEPVARRPSPAAPLASPRPTPLGAVRPATRPAATSPTRPSSAPPVTMTRPPAASDGSRDDSAPRVLPPVATARPQASRIAPPVTAPAVANTDDREIEEILAELPGPLDASLASASPDEVVRRLDALLRDLAAESD